ncbi:MAG: hypothetical protein P9X22_09340 [Candidatus Zapsychrus exili]|nr:hypothetical protein [Candidatus Zapsychrus exili]
MFIFSKSPVYLYRENTSEEKYNLSELLGFIVPDEDGDIEAPADATYNPIYNRISGKIVEKLDTEDGIIITVKDGEKEASYIVVATHLNEDDIVMEGALLGVSFDKQASDETLEEQIEMQIADIREGIEDKEERVDEILDDVAKFLSTKAMFVDQGSFEYETLVEKLKNNDLSTRLAVVSALVNAYGVDPKNTINGLFARNSELRGEDQTTNLLAYVGLNYVPGNAVFTKGINLGGNNSLDIGLAINSRYSQFLQILNMTLGYEDLIAKQGVGAVLGWIFYVEAAAEVFNGFQGMITGFSDRGGIIRPIKRGVWTAVYDAAEEKGDPRIVEKDGETILKKETKSYSVHVSAASAIKDLMRETLGHVIPSLFGDPEKVAIWEARYPIYLPGNVQLRFLKEGIANTDENIIYSIQRGREGEKAEGLKGDASEYIFGYKIDLNKTTVTEENPLGTKELMFASRMFAKDKNGELLLKEWLEKPYNAMYNKEPGEMYIVPSRHTLENVGDLRDVARGYDFDADGEKRTILAAAIHPTTGVVMRKYYKYDGIPASNPVPAFERDGMTIYVAENEYTYEDIKVKSNQDPSLSIGTVDDKPIHPYIIYSKPLADIGYWFGAESTDNTTAHIMKFSKVATNESVNMYEYAGTQEWTEDVKDIKTTELVWKKYDDKKETPIRTAVKMFNPNKGVVDTDKITGEDKYSGDYTEITLPEGLIIVDENTGNITGADEIGIIVEKPAEVPIAVAHLIDRSVYLYTQEEVDALYLHEAGKDLKVNFVWDFAGADSRKINVIRNNSNHDDQTVMIVGGLGLDTKVDENDSKDQPEVGILEYSRASSLEYQKIFTKMVNNKALGMITREDGTIELITKDNFPVTEQIIESVPEKESDDLARYARKDLMNVGEVEGLISIAGIDDIDGEIKALINKTLGLEADISSKDAAYIKAKAEYEKDLDQLVSIEAVLGQESFFARTHAINAMLRGFEEEQKKLDDAITIGEIIAKMSVGENSETGELQINYKDFMTDLREEAVDRNMDINDLLEKKIINYFNSQFFKSSDVAALEEEIRKAQAALNKLYHFNENDPFVTFDEAYLHVYGPCGVVPGTLVQSADLLLPAAQISLDSLQMNLTTAEALLSDIEVNGYADNSNTYNNIVFTQEKISEGFTYEKTDDGQSDILCSTMGRIQRLEHAVIKWQAELVKAQSNVEWKAMVEENLAQTQSWLALEKDTFILLLKMSVIYYDPTGLFYTEAKEMLKDVIALAERRVALTSEDINLLERAKNTNIPNYQGLFLIPLEWDEAELGPRDSDVYTIPEVEAYWMSRLVAIDMEIRAMQEIITNNEISDEAKALFVQLIANLEQERDDYYTNHAKPELEKDRAIQEGTLSEDPADILERKIDKLEALEALYQERLAILQAINALGLSIYTNDVANDREKIIDFEKKMALQALKTVEDRTGLDKAALKEVLGSLTGLLNAAQMELIEKQEYARIKKETEAALESLEDKYTAYIESIREYNKSLEATKEEIFNSYIATLEGEEIDVDVVLAFEAFFVKLEKSMPVLEQIGNTIYYYGNSVANLVTIGGQNSADMNESTWTNVKDVEGLKKIINNSQQYSIFDENFEIYFGTVQATVDGAKNNRYFVMSIPLSDKNSTEILHRFALGSMQSSWFEVDAATIMNEEPSVAAKKDHAVLIIDTFGYKGDKFFAGVVGAMKVSTSSDNVIAAVEGILDYEISSKSRLILELGYGYASKDETRTVKLYDPITNQEMFSEDIRLSNSDNFDSEKLTFRHSFGDNVSLDLALNRVHEDDFMDIFEEQTAIFGSTGIQMHFGEFQLSAEQAFDHKGLVDRNAIKARWGRVSGGFANIEGTQTYNAGVDVIKTDKSRVYFGYRKDVRGNDAFNLSAAHRVSDGITLNGGLNTSDGKKFLGSLGATLDLIRFGKSKDKGPLLSITVDKTKADNEIFPEGLDHNAAEGEYRVEIEGYKDISTIKSTEVVGTDDQVQFGLEAMKISLENIIGRYINENVELGRATLESLSNLPAANIFGGAIFFDGQMPKALTGKEMSLAVNIGSDEALNSPYIGYLGGAGYYLRVPVNGRMHSISLGNSSEVMVILPETLRKYSDVTDMTSEYPVLVESSIPTAERVGHYLSNYGYMSVAGVGFVEITENVINALTDASVSNGTLRNWETIHNLTYNGADLSGAHIEYGLLGISAFEARADARYGVPTKSGVIYLTEAQADARAEELGLAWSQKLGSSVTDNYIFSVPAQGIDYVIADDIFVDTYNRERIAAKLPKDYVGKSKYIWIDNAEISRAHVFTLKSLAKDFDNIRKNAAHIMRIGRKGNTIERFYLGADFWSTKVEIIDNSKNYNNIYDMENYIIKVGQLDTFKQDLQKEVDVLQKQIDEINRKINSGVNDPAKSRAGHTEADVNREARALITSGVTSNASRGWAKATENDKWVSDVIKYYTKINSEVKAQKLDSLVDAGYVRAGPMVTAYGANVIVANNEYVLIATNDNPSMDATLVHESNGGTHLENLQAELAYLEAKLGPIQRKLVGLEATKEDSDAVVSTTSKTEIDVDGNLRITIANILWNTEIIEIRDSKTGKLMRKELPLSKEIVHYDVETGNETYVTDLDNKEGIALNINGTIVSNVVGVFNIAETIDSVGNNIKIVSFVNTRSFTDAILSECDNYASIRRTTYYSDGSIYRDETGFTTILKQTENTVEGMFENVNEYDFRNRDTYIDRGYAFPTREVETRTNGEWFKLHDIIRKGDLKLEDIEVIDFNKLIANEPIFIAFNALGIDSATILNLTDVITVDDIHTFDFRKPYDPQERKIISVRQEQGQVIEIIVGVEFDPRTGEVVKSYKLTSDYRIKGMFVTEKEKVRAEKIFGEYKEVYASAVNDRFPEESLNTLEKYLEASGIALCSDLIVVNEYPALLVTDNETSNSTYTNIFGRALKHYLIPNDSRGRDIAVLYPSKDLGINLWSFEGRDIKVRYNGDEPKSFKTKVGTNPGVISVNANERNMLQGVQIYKAADIEEEAFNVELRGKNKEGELNKGDVVATVTGGKGEMLKVKYANGLKVEGYEYLVLDSKFKRSVVYTLGGRLLAEKFAYVVSQVAKKELSVATNGEEIMIFDVSSPIRLPIQSYLMNGTLEDGTVLKVFADQDFSIDSTGEFNRQKNVFVVNEAEGLAPDQFYSHEYTYLDDELQNKSRYKMFEQWLNHTQAWRIFGTIISVYIGIVVLSGLIARIIKRIILRFRANDKKADPNVVQKYSLDDIEKYVATIDDFAGFGFNEGTIKQIKNNLKALIERRLKAGESFEEIFGEFFDRFVNVWFIPVMTKKVAIKNADGSKDKKTSLLSDTEAKETLEKIGYGLDGKQDFDEDKINEYLKNMYIYNLVNTSADKLAHVTMVHNYFFYKSLQWKDGETQGKNIDRNNFGQHLVEKHYDLWSILLLITTTASKFITKHSTIHQNDVEAYFKTPGFIRFYENGGRKAINEYLVDAAVDIFEAFDGDNYKKSTAEALRQNAYDYIRSGFMFLKSQLKEMKKQKTSNRKSLYKQDFAKSLSRH